MSRILYVTFDQLNRHHGVLKDADPQADIVLLVESQRMIVGRAWHKQRLQFLISSARHFAEELSREGFQVTYLRAETTVDGIDQARAQFPGREVFAATPNTNAK